MDLKKTGLILLFIPLLLPLVSLGGNTYTADLEAGSAQYLSATDSVSLSDTDDITISAWVNFESQPASGAEMIIMSKWNTNKKSFSLRYYNSSGTYKVYFNSSNDGSDDNSVLVNQTFNNETWYHIAAVYTASLGKVEYFVNGSSIGSGTGLDTSIHNNDAQFQIGKTQNYSGSYFDGLIDDVRFYNYARTGAQIASDYDCQLDDYSNLNGYWELDNSLLDTTINNNDLTNNNSVIFQDEDLPFTDACSAGSSSYSPVSDYRLEDFTDELLLTYVYLFLFMGSILLTYKMIC